MSLIGAAAIGAAGSLAGAALNYSSAQDAMKFSKDAYQHRYQWSMNDMRKAGLNPIFAYKGIGSGSPSGVTANFNNPLSGAAEGVNTAIAGKRAAQERRVLESQEQKNYDQAGAANAQDALLRQQHRWNESFLLPIQTKTAAWNAMSAQYQAEAMQKQKSLAEKDASFWLDNPNLRKFQNFIQGFNPLTPKPSLKLRK